MQSDPTTTDDGNITPVLWSVAIAGALLTLGSPLLFGGAGVVSTGLGAGLSVANLWVIALFVRSFLGGGKGRSWGPIGMLKLGALFVLLGVVLKRGWAEALPLAFGYAALPIGVVFAQLRSTAPARGEN